MYWAYPQGGPTQDEILDLATGPNNTTYSVGYFSGIGSFGSTALGSAGLMDAMLIKHNDIGQVLWAVRAGGAGPDKALAVSVDTAGNAYVTGFFSGTADFDTLNLTSAGNEDLFVAKYDANGNLQWAVRGGGAGPDLGNGIQHDANGNVAVGGQFLGSSTFGSTTLNSMPAASSRATLPGCNKVQLLSPIGPWTLPWTAMALCLPWASSRTPSPLPAPTTTT